MPSALRTMTRRPPAQARSATSSTPSAKAPRRPTLTPKTHLLRKNPPPAKDPADKKPDPLPADKVVNSAFADVLGFSSGMPSPLDAIIGKVVWGNVELLKSVYIHLCKDGTKKNDQQWLDGTAHDLLFDKLYGFLYDTLSFLQDIKKKTVTVQGQALGPEKQIDKGEDALKQKFGPYADNVIALASKQLAAKLEALRSPAADNKAVTMEIYLARCPICSRCRSGTRSSRSGTSSSPTSLARATPSSTAS